MNFYKFEPERKTPFAPKFEIVLMEDIVDVNFDNLRDTTGDGFGDEIIATDKNSGRPDAKVPSSVDGEFLDYQFTADDLQQFTGFTIKIVMISTNECSPVRIKDLRVLALA